MDKSNRVVARLALIAIISSALSIAMSLRAADPIYEGSFETSAVDKVPDDLLVLDGAFAVKEDGGNKVLELPGAPIAEGSGVLFGPTETNGVAVSARIHGTAKGRRMPAFAVGLNGVGGYRLQVSPGKKLLELYKGDEALTNMTFTWTSDSWTVLRLQTRKVKEGELKIEGKAWKQGEAEPRDWQISYADRTEAPAGRASIWGSPYAGTPIHYDDLKVLSVAK